MQKNLHHRAANSGTAAIKMRYTIWKNVVHHAANYGASC